MLNLLSGINCINTALKKETYFKMLHEKTSTKSCSQNLRKIHEMPRHLRFNKYVLTHYRPPSDSIGCLKSLFYLHNETVNILTHGK